MLVLFPIFLWRAAFLTGKYEQGKPAPAGSRGESSEYVQKYMTESNYQKLDRLTKFAKDHGRG